MYNKKDFFKYNADNIQKFVLLEFKKYNRVKLLFKTFKILCT